MDFKYRKDYNDYILSVLDTDVSHLLNSQYIFHYFFDRKETIYIHNEGYSRLGNILDLDHLEEIVDDLQNNLSFSSISVDFIAETGKFKRSFLDYLDALDFTNLKIYTKNKKGNLKIYIDGKIVSSIIFAYYIRNVINQMYYEKFIEADLLSRGKVSADELQKFSGKMEYVVDYGVNLFNFDTSLRVDSSTSDTIMKKVGRALSLGQFGDSEFLGTSNFHFAMEYDLPVYDVINNDLYGYYEKTNKFLNKCRSLSEETFSMDLDYLLNNEEQFVENSYAMLNEYDSYVYEGSHPTKILNNLLDELDCFDKTIVLKNLEPNKIVFIKNKFEEYFDEICFGWSKKLLFDSQVPPQDVRCDVKEQWFRIEKLK